MGLFDFASKLFGNKYDKDLQEITPIIEKIKAASTAIQGLTNDELRQKTEDFKTTISASVSAQRKQISELKEKAEDESIDSQEKETLYKQVDTLEKEVTSTIEEQLNLILPEAFSVVKETASRFSQGNIEVTANDFDRDLAARYDHVVISNDKATHHKKWIAAGTEITWDMVHYDVQLIGGHVLHSGKI
ncbi:MAG: preprotein translocase subunit SecA, partial [Bacteroidetes bacterium]|nr:preprotein translocase subunit SecA [Bacteroidota bacterium]